MVPWSHTSLLSKWHHNWFSHFAGLADEPVTQTHKLVIGTCLCTMLAYSFFLQSCFVFFNVFFVFLKMFLVGLATDCAVVFYE